MKGNLVFVLLGRKRRRRKVFSEVESTSEHSFAPPHALRGRYLTVNALALSILMSVISKLFCFMVI